MKKVKILMAAFVVSCVVSAMGVNAAQTVGLTNITVPALVGTYSTGYHSKTQDGHQYAKKTSAIDSLSGDERAVKARLAGVDNDFLWVTLPKGTKTQIHSGYSQLGDYTGSFSLQLRHVKVLATTSTFNGTWWLY